MLSIAIIPYFTLNKTLWLLHTAHTTIDKCLPSPDVLMSRWNRSYFAALLGMLRLPQLFSHKRRRKENHNKQLPSSSKEIWNVINIYKHANTFRWVTVSRKKFQLHPDDDTEKADSQLSCCGKKSIIKKSHKIKIVSGRAQINSNFMLISFIAIIKYTMSCER